MPSLHEALGLADLLGIDKDSSEEAVRAAFNERMNLKDNPQRSDLQDAIVKVFINALLDRDKHADLLVKLSDKQRADLENKIAAVEALERDQRNVGSSTSGGLAAAAAAQLPMRKKALTTFCVGLVAGQLNPSDGLSIKQDSSSNSLEHSEAFKNLQSLARLNQAESVGSEWDDEPVLPKTPVLSTASSQISSNKDADLAAKRELDGDDATSKAAIAPTKAAFVESTDPQDWLARASEALLGLQKDNPKSEKDSWILVVKQNLPEAERQLLAAQQLPIGDSENNSKIIEVAKAVIELVADTRKQQALVAANVVILGRRGYVEDDEESDINSEYGDEDDEVKPKTPKSASTDEALRAANLAIAALEQKIKGSPSAVAEKEVYEAKCLVAEAERLAAGGKLIQLVEKDIIDNLKQSLSVRQKRLIKAMNEVRFESYESLGDANILAAIADHIKSKLTNDDREFIKKVCDYALIKENEQINLLVTNPIGERAQDLIEAKAQKSIQKSKEAEQKANTAIASIEQRAQNRGETLKAGQKAFVAQMKARAPKTEAELAQISEAKAQAVQAELAGLKKQARNPDDPEPDAAELAKQALEKKAALEQMLKVRAGGVAKTPEELAEESRLKAEALKKEIADARLKAGADPEQPATTAKLADLLQARLNRGNVAPTTAPAHLPQVTPTAIEPPTLPPSRPVEPVEFDAYFEALLKAEERVYPIINKIRALPANGEGLAEDFKTVQAASENVRTAIANLELAKDVKVQDILSLIENINKQETTFQQRYLDIAEASRLIEEFSPAGAMVTAEMYYLKGALQNALLFAQYTAEAATINGYGVTPPVGPPHSEGEDERRDIINDLHRLRAEFGVKAKANDNDLITLAAINSVKNAAELRRAFLEEANDSAPPDRARTFTSAIMQDALQKTQLLQTLFDKMQELVRIDRVSPEQLKAIAELQTEMEKLAEVAAAARSWNTPVEEEQQQPRFSSGSKMSFASGETRSVSLDSDAEIKRALGEDDYTSKAAGNRIPNIDLDSIKWVPSIGDDNLCGFASFVLPLNAVMADPDLFYSAGVMPEKAGKFITLYAAKMGIESSDQLKAKAEINGSDPRQVQEICALSLKEAFAEYMRQDTSGESPFDKVLGMVLTDFLNPGRTELPDYADFLRKFITDNKAQFDAMKVAYDEMVDEQHPDNAASAKVDSEKFLNFIKDTNPPLIQAARDYYCEGVIADSYMGREIDLIYIAGLIGFRSLTIDHSGGVMTQELGSDSQVDMLLKHRGAHWEAAPVQLEPQPRVSLSEDGASTTGYEYELYKESIIAEINKLRTKIGLAEIPGTTGAITIGMLQELSVNLNRATTPKQVEELIALFSLTTELYYIIGEEKHSEEVQLKMNEAVEEFHDFSLDFSSAPLPSRAQVEEQMLASLRSMVYQHRNNGAVMPPDIAANSDYSLETLVNQKTVKDLLDAAGGMLDVISQPGVDANNIDLAERAADVLDLTIRLGVMKGLVPAEAGAAGSAENNSLVALRDAISTARAKMAGAHEFSDNLSESTTLSAPLEPPSGADSLETKRLAVIDTSGMVNSNILNNVVCSPALLREHNLNVLSLLEELARQYPLHLQLIDAIKAYTPEADGGYTDYDALRSRIQTLTPDDKVLKLALESALHGFAALKYAENVVPSMPPPFRRTASTSSASGHVETGIDLHQNLRNKCSGDDSLYRFRSAPDGLEFGKVQDDDTVKLILTVSDPEPIAASGNSKYHCEIPADQANEGLNLLIEGMRDAPAGTKMTLANLNVKEDAQQFLIKYYETFMNEDVLEIKSNIQLKFDTEDGSLDAIFKCLADDSDRPDNPIDLHKLAFLREHFGLNVERIGIAKEAAKQKARIFGSRHAAVRLPPTPINPAEQYSQNKQLFDGYTPPAKSRFGRSHH